MKKIQNRKWELENPNFDHYVKALFSEMTEAQRSMLPPDLSYKVGKGSKYSTSMLTFVQKLWILSTIYNKRVSLIIEDEKGIPVNAFKKILQAQHGKIATRELVDEFRHAGAFFLGDHDLMSWFEYANMVCATPMYKLMTGYKADLKDRSKVQVRHQRIQEATYGMLKMLVHYEGNKKRMSSDYDVTMPEWYALMFFYEQESTMAKFQETFKYAYISNTKDLYGAITKLKRKDMIGSRGTSKRYFKYYITPKGKEMVIRLMTRIVFGE